MFFIKDQNYILSQKMSTETGLRDLSLRYITVILQICLKPKGIKYSSKLIFEILKSVLPKHISMGDLGIDTLNKYIKDIDINNSKQSYQTTFENMKVYFEILENNEQEALLKQQHPEPYKQLTDQDEKDLARILQKQKDDIQNGVQFIQFKWLEYYNSWKQSEIYTLYKNFIDTHSNV